MWVALGHHVGRLEACVGDLSNRERLVVRLLSRDDRSIGGNHEVNTGVWHKVGLELSQIDVEGTIEAERGSERGDDLTDETVQVSVGWALNVEAATADVVQGLVVEHDSDVSVLKEGVGGEHGVVGLHNGSGDLGGGVHAEAELGLLTVVNGKTLEQEGAKARASTTTDGVEHHEALEASALVCELAKAIEGEVNNLFTHGVMATGVVVGCILLARDQLLWVVELAVGPSAHLIDHGWFEVEVDATGNMLASTSLREEGVEGVISTTNGLVGGHLAIRLDTVLQAVKLPATVTDLATALADMDGDSLAHIF